jgi:predicted cupin superfamily sugar epimerase
MSSRAEQLIKQLELQPHPEGGWYAEIFRSTLEVHPEDGRGARGGMTTIYFLLTRGQRSRLHRVMSDEVWHFYEGDPLRLSICDPTFGNLRDVTVGPLSREAAPVCVVPAGEWQAAVSLGEYSLTGCSVGPGFDFADFSMLGDDGERVEQFLAKHPTRADLVQG